MPDVTEAPGGQADKTCAYLIEISPEMRGCAILGAEGDVRASTGSSSDGETTAGELSSRADAAGSEPFSHLHVSTGDGDVFYVRAEGLAAIAVTERLALSSLVLFDLRNALHDLAEKGKS